MPNYIFVTVGANHFDDLVKAVSTKEFIKNAKNLGYTGIHVQIGDGEYIPENFEKDIDSFDSLDEFTQSDIPSSSNEAEDLDSPNSLKSTNPSFICKYFRYKPSIYAERFLAALVITHDGSASIIETLKMKKPIVVVSENVARSEFAKKLNEMEKITINKLVDNIPGRKIEPPVPAYPTLISPKFEGIKSFSQVLEDSEVLNLKNKKNVKFLAILTEGAGHTSQLLSLIDSLDFKKYSNRNYLIKHYDSLAGIKITKIEEQSVLVSRGGIYNIFSYSFTLKFLHLIDTKVCFIERLSHVKTLSKAGQFLKNVADLTIVQWPDIQEKGMVLANFMFKLEEQKAQLDEEKKEK